MARDAGVQVEFRELAGDIGHALARLAEVLDAEMIVVGSRRGGGCAPACTSSSAGRSRCTWPTGSPGRWWSSLSPPSRKASCPGSTTHDGPEPAAAARSGLEAAEASAGPPRPVHLSPANVALVAVGGAAGTGLRYWISAVIPHWAGVPVATFGINVVGAFLLGVLLELLAGSSLDSGWSRRLRLGIGTGGLGGFTTYSALATDTVTLAAAHPGQAAGYALATVIIGAVASMPGSGSPAAAAPGRGDARTTGHDTAVIALLVCAAGGVGAALGSSSTG